MDNRSCFRRDHRGRGIARRHNPLLVPALTQKAEITSPERELPRGPSPAKEIGYATRLCLRRRAMNPSRPAPPKNIGRAAGSGVGAGTVGPSTNPRNGPSPVMVPEYTTSKKFLSEL